MIKKLNELKASDLSHAIELETPNGGVRGILAGVQFSITGRENTVTVQIGLGSMMSVNLTFPAEKEIVIYT